MQRPPWSQLALRVIARPIGPLCNFRCDYCDYLEKEALYPESENWRMSDETLEAYVRQYVEAQPEAVQEIDFTFQGGEPTLMGLNFFRRVVELQKKYVPPGRRVHNTLQTNGVLLDDHWCEFLREHDFLVGLSIDGPINLHDTYRRDKQGRRTFDEVARAMRRLFRHGVEFTALCCVHCANGEHPVRVYRFLRDSGIQSIRFIPVVERLSDTRVEGTTPGTGPESPVSERSVDPKQFGRFLIGVFDEWVRNDVGRVFVRDFDQALAAWTGLGARLCIYTEECGRSIVVEHNGDLYSCDHFVDAEHRLGNIHEAPIKKLASAPRQKQFGRDKRAKLPKCCRRCEVLFACNGACPKDRFINTPDGEPGLNYLCEGYKMFFTHIAPSMKFMADELRAGRPAGGVMHHLRAQREHVRKPADGNGPCPCGSGKKYKDCCMPR